MTAHFYNFIKSNNFVAENSDFSIGGDNMSAVLYRKYRSKRFCDVVGQSHITDILKKQVSEGSFTHAYLFTGSRGTGKTSCAKILAKALNCLTPQDGEPCLECELCRGAENETLLDITELDAASNSGVDEIRNLRTEAFYTPTAGKYRVYIIDEVHMLSPNAFNALLKIMEEPPPHVVFILATTELHKVLPTVISRCQRFDFRRLSVGDIKGHLLNIAQSEGLPLTDDGAEQLARLAEGGMRDALSLLQVAAGAGETINRQHVMHTTGLLGEEHIFTLFDHIINSDITSGITFTGEMFERTADSAQLCRQILTHLRNLMIADALSDPTDIVSYLPLYIPELKRQATALGRRTIMQMAGRFQEVLVRIPKSAAKQLETELAIMEALTGYEPTAERVVTAVHKPMTAPTPPPKPTPPKTEVPEAVITPPTPKPSTPPPPPTPSVVDYPPSPDIEPFTDVIAPSEEQYTTVTAEPTTPTPIVTPELFSPPSAEDGIVPFTAWQSVIKRLCEINPATGGLFGESDAYVDGKRVLIKTASAVLMSLLKSNKDTRDNIKRAIAEVTGIRYAIGPYQQSETPVETSTDPLDSFIKGLPQSPKIKVV